MKNKNKLIIFLATVGYILIILATYISTVEIPRLDKQINEAKEEVNRLNKKIERGILLSLNYRQNELKKRINFLELNNLILHNSAIELQNEIKRRIVSQNYDIIKVWSQLWNLDESEVYIKEIKNILDTIMITPDSFDEKIVKLEKLFLEVLEEVRNNLKLIQDKREIKITNKDDLEKIRLSYFKFFILFQIIGLLFISITTIFEKML